MDGFLIHEGDVTREAEASGQRFDVGFVLRAVRAGLESLRIKDPNDVGAIEARFGETEAAIAFDVVEGFDAENKLAGMTPTETAQ